MTGRFLFFDRQSCLCMRIAIFGCHCTVSSYIIHTYIHTYIQRRYTCTYLLVAGITYTFALKSYHVYMYDTYIYMFIWSTAHFISDFAMLCFNKPWPIPKVRNGAAGVLFRSFMHGHHQCICPWRRTCFAEKICGPEGRCLALMVVANLQGGAAM